MYDDVDRYWSAHYSQGKDFSLMTSQFLDTILAHVDATQPKNNLDIGCGTGQLTRELNHRGYSCIGVDASRAAIETAKRLTLRKDELQYVHGDIEQMEAPSFPGSPYSLITCKLVYAFIRNRAELLKKVQSLLGDKGSFVIITPVIQSISEDKKEIAVDYDDTLRELSNYFNNISTLEGARVISFVCQ